MYLLLLWWARRAKGEGPSDCVGIVGSSSTFVGKCENKWEDLKALIRPTQSGVGYAWVQRNYEKHFGSDDEAQEAVADPIPAIFGPGSMIYIIDSHHTLCALDYSGRNYTTVTIDIVCDWRPLSTEDFWYQMAEHDFVYLLSKDSANALPKSIAYTALPTRFAFTEKDKVFADDPWRALAGFSRKYADDNDECDDFDDYCERCFIRNCDSFGNSIPFIEFKWAYFFNDAYLNATLWQSNLDPQIFFDAYNALPSDFQLNADLNQWLDTAANLIDLCRSDLTGAYILPPSLDSTALPGYVRGDTQLPDDPDCNLPLCPYYSPTAQPTFLSHHLLSRTTPPQNGNDLRFSNRHAQLQLPSET